MKLDFKIHLHFNDVKQWLKLFSHILQKNIPSSVKSWARTLSPTLLLLFSPVRLTATASISSKKMIVGATCDVILFFYIKIFIFFCIVNLLK